MDTKSLWTDPISLAFLWPPLFLAWMLSLYRLSSKVDPLVWTALAVILLLMVVNIVWIASGRARADQPDALPWYLVIGPPRSGKATLLQNAGVKEAATTRSMRRRLGPYFAAHTVALEQLGAFVLYREVEVDQPTQQELVSQTVQVLRGKPLQGVLVTIGMDSLADAGVCDQAAVLRERLHDLIAQLGWNVPIYLVVTKCDHLRGFAAYFAGLTPADRAQAWGATLSGNVPGQAGEIVAQECQALHLALDQRRLASLSRGDARANREAYQFPMEFTGACLQLCAFVESLFAPMAAQDQLMFRGLYFTALAQQPTSLDRCGYFISDLLTKILWTDQGLARATTRAIRHRWLWRMALAVGAFLVGVAILVPV